MIKTKAVWKLQLEIKEGIQEFKFPKCSRILSMQSQGGVPTIWYSVDLDEKETVIGKFRVVGTGEQVSYNEDTNSYTFIGTMQLGVFVFHVFEIREVIII